MQALEQLNRALGQVRAEYANDDELYGRFAFPLYAHQLTGITPTFLVGGRGTGKTTTLRSLAFRGQQRIHRSTAPEDWDSIGAYWKAEPTVVSVFRGKGVSDETWSNVFGHYLNLRLCSLVLEYAEWLGGVGHTIKVDKHAADLFAISLNIPTSGAVEEFQRNIDLSIASIEASINGQISNLTDTPLSILGKPIDYIFRALPDLGATLAKPFIFCIDEYENLSAAQQQLLNTLVKQVGNSAYTFKIGVRNKVAIERGTLIDHQPLQDPADFATVDIVRHLKDASFESFAQTVVEQRLSTEDLNELPLGVLLPGLGLDEEAGLLGSDELRVELSDTLRTQGATEEQLAFSASLSAIDAALVLRWSQSHTESALEVLNFARLSPAKWKTRVGNYGHALLFTIRQRRIGERKFYTGWKTYCQLADGNIRYLLRLIHEALRRHLEEGNELTTPVSFLNQTQAAKRVGEITVRDLQGWSKQGAALTRLTVGLGGIFGALARSNALTTPEVVQFRVRYAGSSVPATDVDALLAEAVGQGVLIDFAANKEAADKGAPPDLDYQLHPVLAPAFAYSHRSKRRLIIQADDVISLTQRDTATAAFRRILLPYGSRAGEAPNQLDIFAEVGK